MYDIWDVWSENTCQGHVQTNYTDWKTYRKEFRTTMLMCKPVLFGQMSSLLKTFKYLVYVPSRKAWFFDYTHTHTHLG